MHRRLGVVALIGVVAVHIWGVGFSPAFYQLYLLAGSPEHPTPLQWYPAVVGVSFVFGFAGAFLCRFVTPPSGHTAIVFLGPAALSFFVTTTFFVGLSGVLVQLSSYGFWGFVLGALVSVFIPRRVAT